MRNIFKTPLPHLDSAGWQRLWKSALLLVDGTLNVVHANAHAERLLRIRTGAMEGAPVSLLFKDPRAVETFLRNTLSLKCSTPDHLPTYLLRKAKWLDTQPLLQVVVHSLADDGMGAHLLLQMKHPRAIPMRGVARHNSDAASYVSQR